MQLCSSSLSFGVFVKNRKREDESFFLLFHLLCDPKLKWNFRGRFKTVPAVVSTECEDRSEERLNAASDGGVGGACSRPLPVTCEGSDDSSLIPLGFRDRRGTEKTTGMKAGALRGAG